MYRYRYTIIHILLCSVILKLLGYLGWALANRKWLHGRRRGWTDKQLHLEIGINDKIYACSRYNQIFILLKFCLLLHSKWCNLVDCATYYVLYRILQLGYELELFMSTRADSEWLMRQVQVDWLVKWLGFNLGILLRW